MIEGLNTIQISLMAALLIILPLGFLNMLRMKKKKKQFENFDYSNSSGTQNTSEDFSNEIIKNYILQYKAQYPRDTIKSALINSGNDPQMVEKYLNKFF